MRRRARGWARIVDLVRAAAVGVDRPAADDDGLGTVRAASGAPLRDIPADRLHQAVQPCDGAAEAKAKARQGKAR